MGGKEGTLHLSMVVNSIKLSFTELIRRRLKEGIEEVRQRKEERNRWWLEGTQRKGEKNIEKQIPAKGH